MLKWSVLALAICISLVLAGIALISQPFVEPITSEAIVVDPDRLRNHVQKLSVEFYPRSFEQAKNTKLTVDYIAAEFAKAGARVSFQDFKIDNETYQNVIAQFGPINSSAPLVIVGAHYDSHGDTFLGAKSTKGYSPASHTPGADDNASGIAGIIELAYALGKSKPKSPIELVAYSSEEPPNFRTMQMGSAVHANQLVASRRPVKLMLSVEMIGFFSDEKNSQRYPVPGMAALYSNTANFAAVVGNLSYFSQTRRVKAIMQGASDLPVFSSMHRRSCPA